MWGGKVPFKNILLPSSVERFWEPLEVTGDINITFSTNPVIWLSLGTFLSSLPAESHHSTVKIATDKGLGELNSSSTSITYKLCDPE